MSLWIRPRKAGIEHVERKGLERAEVNCSPRSWWREGIGIRDRRRREWRSADSNSGRVHARERIRKGRGASHVADARRAKGERRGQQVLQSKLLFGPVEVNSKTSANAGLSGTAGELVVGAPGKTKARSEILILGLDATGAVATRVSGKHQTSRSGRKNLRLFAGNKAVEGESLIKNVFQWSVDLPADSIGDRQVAAQLELVLCVGIVRLSSGVDEAAAALRVVVGNPE